MKKMEQTTDELRLHNLNLRTKIQDLEQRLEHEYKVQTQLQKQLNQISAEYQTVQEHATTKHTQVEQAEVCINRLNSEMRRVHSTLEAGSKKVQELSKELQSVTDQLKRVTRERDELQAQDKRLKQELHEFRITHQTPDDEASYTICISKVKRLNAEMERLTEETKHLDQVCRSESNQCLELTTELSDVKASEVMHACMYVHGSKTTSFTVNLLLCPTPQEFEKVDKFQELRHSRTRKKQQAEELRKVQTECDTKHRQLEQTREIVRELQTQLKDANEQNRGLSHTVNELTQALRARCMELDQTQLEVKNSLAQLKNTEMSVEELEMQVQQLTRQLEHSEALRAEAQNASNETSSLAAQLRIELAKRDEQLNATTSQLESSKQRVELLEKASAQQELTINEQMQERAVRESIIQRMEHEITQIKSYCSELEQELSATQERSVAMRSDLIQTQSALEEVASRQYMEDNSRGRMEASSATERVWGEFIFTPF
ncbi:unnamed protein product [Echinostoma caproni]|uniref:Coiled-coil domain-containing protein 150 n=1 Tax=Echinostoma caproni TaxID=27848 RepID=A0A183AA03_9TREM|nr:unnamed protein product [Echinostoma caproni]